MEFFKSEYKGAFKFLKRLRLLILILVILFFVVAVASHYILSDIYKNDPAKMQEQIQQLMEMMESKDLLDESGQISAFGLFCNNFIASGISVAMGVVPFLFIPLIMLLINAVLIGVVSAIMSVASIGGFYEMFVSVAPHGIFEIPALLICVAMGLALCKDISARIIYRKRGMPFLQMITELLRVTVLVVVPMLMIAAVIEAYITPTLMGLLL